ncbi:hypothetical protein KC19_1G159100 [Ceratodon purpureus]|uniref:Uncharacterized protein n=1 Tax=Ceratodon purpureus TaxID=3225 RepID=A0A8T0J6H3_CERPU|nr:hypothetical protein KC19_1G159100 [Ceratodon purpureus]
MGSTSLKFGDNNAMPPVRIELTTFPLRRERSTTKPWRQEYSKTSPDSMVHLQLLIASCKIPLKTHFRLIFVDNSKHIT